MSGAITPTTSRGGSTSSGSRGSRSFRSRLSSSAEAEEDGLVELLEDEDGNDDDDDDSEDDDGAPLLEALADDEADLIRRYRERKKRDNNFNQGRAGGRRTFGLALLLSAASAALAALFFLTGSWSAAAPGSGSGAFGVWQFGLGGGGGTTATEDAARAAASSLVRLRSSLDAARRDLDNRLRDEYGAQYYDALFTRPDPLAQEDAQEDVEDVGGSSSSALSSSSRPRVSVGRFMFQSPTFHDDLGPARLRRKMMRKLLEVVAGDDDDNSHNNNSVAFVWATGGHSSSAGHGNLYNESYTATLETYAADVFEAAGITFEGRNRAMGGTSSYPEIALCGEEVFGLDIDLLSWDYGMTDGNDAFGMLQYYYRMGYHPNHPAFVAIPRKKNDPAAHGTFTKHVEAMRVLETMGLPSLLFHHEEYESTVAGIPDTIEYMASHNGSSLESMPFMVRAFKCDGSLEKGDPCQAAKFTSTPECPKRGKQASWHEGFKWHGLMGRLMALGLVEALSDALDELLLRSRASAASSSSAALDVTRVRAELDSVDAAERSLFRYAKLPDMAGDMELKYPHTPDNADKRMGGGYTLEQMYRTPAYCHTALVPSEYRYRGLHLEDGSLLPGERLGPSTCERDSISLLEARERPEDVYPVDNVTGLVPDGMRLAYDEKEREKCNLTTYLDYKDFFLIRHGDDWKRSTVPTEAAVRAYPHRDASHLAGRIAVCLTPWSTDKERDVHPDTFGEGLLAFEVNGIAATGFDKVHSCYALRYGTSQELDAFRRNDEGRFDVRVKVLREGSVAKITSIIVW